mmetsp:Transcript_33452/g.59496  ORF Transcript_33452/g.59496 Transcript_33452/m.59496 type:complete len:277 (-) Transcript_33452:75-905(-)
MAPDTKKRKRGADGKQFLIILDMNGVLLLRPKGGAVAKFRPYLNQFVDTLWEHYPRLNVGVWSSMMTHNLHPLVEEVFGTRCKDLAFVYDQSWCNQSWVEGMRKPLLRKDLVWLNGTDFYSHYAGNRILLVDDDPIKCTENPKGTAVHPLSFEGDDGDTELLRLGSYLSALAQSGCNSVPDFTLQNPYESFEQDEEVPAAPRLKRLRSSDSGASWTETFNAGDDVEAFWPDDGSWIPAQVVETLSDGNIRIYWDGSESIVPADYVRYPWSSGHEGY